MMDRIPLPVPTSRSSVSGVSILAQLADTQLCRLMHTGSEGGSRINMNQIILFLILRLYLFPGGNDQDIIHIKLMEDTASSC